MGSVTRETLKMHGEVEFTVSPRDGAYSARKYRQSNLIVNTGKNYAAQIFSGNAIPLNKIAIGTGNTPALTVDTGLESLAATDLYPYGPAVIDSGYGVYLNAIFDGSEWAGSVSEAGLFGGTVLFSRIVLATPQVLLPSEVMQVTWQVLFI